MHESSWMFPPVLSCGCLLGNFFAFACHLINDIVPYMIANARVKNLTLFFLWIVFFVLHYQTKQQNFDQKLDNIHDWIKIYRLFIEKVDILQKWYPLFQPRHNLGVLAFWNHCPTWEIKHSWSMILQRWATMRKHHLSLSTFFPDAYLFVTKYEIRRKM